MPQKQLRYPKLDPCHQRRDEWFFDKTYFDLLRAVARFHMSRMIPRSHIQTRESRWFKDSRANPAFKEHERTLLWDLEEIYGLAHEEDEYSRTSG